MKPGAPAGMSCCGIRCEAECAAFPRECAGCAAALGAPPWVAFCGTAACPVYECCVQQRGRRYCGGCEQLPCARYNRYPSPLMSEEEHRQSVLGRAAALRAFAPGHLNEK